MDHNSRLSAHETMELHEIVKTTFNETKMLQQYYDLAKDSRTQTVIMDAINCKENQIAELEQFIKKHGILQ